MDMILPLLLYLNKHKETIITTGLAGAVANPKTRRAGIIATKWSARHLLGPAAYHGFMAGAVPTKNLVRLLGPYAARATGAVAAGALGS